MKRTVNYMPESARNYRYIVATNVDGELYYWGAWDEGSKAYEVARQINAEVVENLQEDKNTAEDERLQFICSCKERSYRNTKKGTFTAESLLLDIEYLNKVLATD